MFVNNNIRFKYLQSFRLPGDIKAILFVSIYRAPDQNFDYFLSSITGLLDYYLKSYEDFVIMGDFNANESNPAMGNFFKSTQI